MFTARYQGWSGLYGDRALSYEQNLTVRKIAVLVLTAIDWHSIRKSLSLIEAAIDVAAPGSCREIECGVFNRKLARS